MESIECMICGREFKQITHKHLKTHELSMDEYREKFPNSPVISGRLLSKLRNNGNNSLESNLKKSKSQKGKPKKDSSVSKMRKTKTGKSMSKEHRASISESLTGRSLSEQTKQKLRKAMTGKKHSEATKQKLREMFSGSKHPSYGKKSFHKQTNPVYVDRHGNELRLRSTWELKVARYLDDHEVNWRYEEIKYEFPKFTYTPDFFIYEGNTLVKIIEVKGWMKDRDREKLSAFREKHPNLTLEVWGREELVQMGIKL